MIRTPQTQTFILAAGERKPVDLSGKWLEIVSCTVPMIRVAFGAETEQDFYPGKGYPGPSAGFDRFTLVDPGAGCTVVVTVSDQALSGAGSSLLAAISATLTTISGYLLSIWTRFAGAAAAADKADTNVAITGGAATLLYAANAARKSIEVQALDTNGGTVYIGSAAMVSATNKRAMLAAGDSWYDEHYTGAVYAVGSDALQWVCGSEE